VATAQDLPVGAAVCGANRQDASFVDAALADVVIDLPVEPPPPPPSPYEQHMSPLKLSQDQQPRRADGKLSTVQRQQVKRELMESPDVRAMPYLRADGNFAKDPPRLQAKQQRFRLWAPRPDQSRRGLGPIRSSVERAHAMVNQFGRIARRLDRCARRYLGWVQFACCLIFMRRGFFP
jgi:transposase